MRCPGGLDAGDASGTGRGHRRSRRPTRAARSRSAGDARRVLGCAVIAAPASAEHHVAPRRCTSTPSTSSSRAGDLPATCAPPSRTRPLGAPGLSPSTMPVAYWASPAGEAAPLKGRSGAPRCPPVVVERSEADRAGSTPDGRGGRAYPRPERSRPTLVGGRWARSGREALFRQDHDLYLYFSRSPPHHAHLPTNSCQGTFATSRSKAKPSDHRPDIDRDLMCR